jgi:serine/threonine protein phosphatase PrpC
MIRVTTFSEAGGHLENEDAFAARPHPFGSDHWVCFLADGQGGQAGGGDAARLACRTAIELAIRSPIRSLRDPDVWKEILRAADRAVFADPKAGFTTLLGLLITGEFVAGGSCGDSEVLMLSAGGPARYLTHGQRKNPPVGSGAAEFISFSAAIVRPWSVLAMSDGVWKSIGAERLVEAVRAMRGERLVARLQTLARLPRGGQFSDDFTVVVFEGDE